MLAAVTLEQKPDELDQLLEIHDLRKTLRVCAWITRFIRNSRRESSKTFGPITTAEIESRKTCWIRRVQTRSLNSPKFAADKLQLNLQPNREGILECHGRIQGHYPTYLPDDSAFTEKLVAWA